MEEEEITKYDYDLKRYCMYLTKNRADQMDLYQQTILTLLEQKAKGNNYQDLKIHLIILAKRIFYNQMRDKKVSFNGARDYVPLDPIYHDKYSTVENSSDNLFFDSWLNKLLSEFPDKLVNIITWKMNGYTLREIGVMLDCTKQNVSHLLNNKKLKKRALIYINS